jgi:hypothetical protein
MVAHCEISGPLYGYPVVVTKPVSEKIKFSLFGNILFPTIGKRICHVFNIQI